jgi:hypothetical protein
MIGNDDDDDDDDDDDNNNNRYVPYANRMKEQSVRSRSQFSFHLC